MDDVQIAEFIGGLLLLWAVGFGAGLSVQAMRKFFEQI